MSSTNLNSVLATLDKLPKLTTLIEEFQQEGKDFLTHLYTIFKGDIIYSSVISTDLPTRNLCCLRFGEYDFEKLNRKLTLKDLERRETLDLCATTAGKLGKAGQHGIPFIFKTNNDNYKLVKLSRGITISKPRDWDTLPGVELTSDSKLNHLYACWLPTNYASTKYWSLDEFTNETVIAGMIDTTWKEGILYQYKNTFSSWINPIIAEGRKIPVKENLTLFPGTSPHDFISCKNFFPYVVHDSAALCGENAIKIIEAAFTDEEGKEVPAETVTCVKQNRQLTGLNLMEFCNMKNLVDLPEYKEHYGPMLNKDNHPIFSIKEVPTSQEYFLKPTIAKGILFHIIYAFHFLHKTLVFNHGDAKAGNVFLHNYGDTTTVTWPINGEHKVIEAPFCAKLADYGKSSATLITNKESVRVFWEPEASFREPKASLQQGYKYTQRKTNPFKPEVQVLPNYKGTGQTIYTYSTTNSSVNVIYNRLRMLGSPYYKSYDVYMFLVSFFLQVENFYTLSLFPDFRAAVWDIMWHHSPEDGKLVKERIRKKIASNYASSELSRTGILIEILRGTRLACNITSPLLDSLAVYDAVADERSD
jgi:hypothetical protein